MNKGNLATDIISRQNRKIKMLTVVIIVLALLAVATNVSWYKKVNNYKRYETIMLKPSERADFKPKVQRMKKEG